jgi:hypothetical protein
MTPEQAKERARKAANSRWARPTASAEQSETIREALWKRWEALVDPEQDLPFPQRRRLAQRALAAHMAGMRLARANKTTRT